MKTRHRRVFTYPAMSSTSLMSGFAHWKNDQPIQNKGRYLAYLRVSTPRQGEGVSLLTQREAIARFAIRHHLEVIEWLEEKETGAKRGRPVFGQILRRLQKGQADGLIVPQD